MVNFLAPLGLPQVSDTLKFAWSGVTDESQDAAQHLTDVGRATAVASPIQQFEASLLRSTMPL
jgi:hypothetical protein